MNALDTAGSAYGTTLNQNAMTAGNFKDLQVEGVLTAGNRSATNQVFTFGSDAGMQMAYISRISGDIPGDVTFSAPSFGIVAQCEPITPQCFSSSAVMDGRPYFNDSVSYDCADAGYPDFVHPNDVSIYEAFSIPQTQLADSSNANPPFHLAQNPFTAIYQSPLLGTTQPYNDSIVAMSGFGTGISRFLMVGCKISVYDITLRYSSGIYTVVDKKLSQPSVAEFLTVPLSLYQDDYGIDYLGNISTNFPILDRLQSDMLVSTASDSAQLGLYASGEIARLLLSFSAGYLSSTHATQITTAGVVTRYPYASLGADLLFIYLYSLFAISVFLWVSTGRIHELMAPQMSPSGTIPLQENSAYREIPLSTKKLAKNAKGYVSQSALLVAALSGQSTARLRPSAHPRPVGWVEEDIDELFDGENSGDMARFEIGLKTIVLPDGQHKQDFGVWKSGTDHPFLAPSHADQQQKQAGYGYSSPSLARGITAESYPIVNHAYPPVSFKPKNTNATPRNQFNLSGRPRQFSIPLLARISALLISFVSACLATGLILWLLFRYGLSSRQFCR